MYKRVRNSAPERQSEGEADRDDGSAAKSVLAIGAHPAEAEFLCGGTLALLRQEGWRVVLAAVTPCATKAAAVPRAELAKAPLAAARRSAAVLEAEFYCLQSSGTDIFFSDPPCRLATGLIRLTRPGLVLTHSPLDHLPDHEETSRIVRQACSAAPRADYEVTQFPGGEVPVATAPHLYYFDPGDGKDFLGHAVKAARIVDISSAAARKQEVLAAFGHRSEERLEELRYLGRKRGREAGCAVGEGFRQHIGDGFPDSDLLRATLGARVHAVS
ncbi:MAG: PIG-L family deacetylase [Planctomycetes bacterium]|nr:PIG-L family deacetylase [Planctomycetota bacterium]